MQVYGDLLNEILGECAPSSKHVHLKQSAKDWPKTVVTDARDVFDNLSTEKGGLPQQKALTPEIATIREWLVNSDTQIRWTTDENMIMNGLRVLQHGEWSVQQDAALIREKSVSQAKRTRRTKQTPTHPYSEELHDKFCVVEHRTLSWRMNRSESLNRTSMCQCHRFWKRSSKLKQLSTFSSCSSNSFLCR